MTEIKGVHVLTVFVMCFSVIIGVNLTLAFNAVRTFPGLEVENSYVASQSFDADRAAQTALGWDVTAWLDGDHLHLLIEDDLGALAPTIESAVFGRATSVQDDQIPQFEFNGQTYSAPVHVSGGNWNLRIVLMSDEGVPFQQRVVVRNRS